MITRERLLEEFALLDEKARLMGSEVIRLYPIGSGNLALKGLRSSGLDKFISSLEELLSGSEVKGYGSDT
ncbi:hypothetical protein [Thermococcus paralvinellae]|uniref:hypothetical protein n=1 Tax=Thermococcus paralvinellae TaxID=582419 RepID=UPI0005B2CD44|nr:hypothetical protein [Thermococcus paralvinellae]